MDKQVFEFAIQKKDGVIQKIGSSHIIQPEIKFKGGTIKWYEDKPKQEGIQYEKIHS